MPPAPITCGNSFHPSKPRSCVLFWESSLIPSLLPRSLFPLVPKGDMFKSWGMNLCPPTPVLPESQRPGRALEDLLVNIFILQTRATPVPGGQMTGWWHRAGWALPPHWPPEHPSSPGLPFNSLVAPSCFSLLMAPPHSHFLMSVSPGLVLCPLPVCSPSNHVQLRALNASCLRQLPNMHLRLHTPGTADLGVSSCPWGAPET